MENALSITELDHKIALLYPHGAMEVGLWLGNLK